MAFRLRLFGVLAVAALAACSPAQDSVGDDSSEAPLAPGGVITPQKYRVDDVSGGGSSGWGPTLIPFHTTTGSGILQEGLSTGVGFNDWVRWNTEDQNDQQFCWPDRMVYTKMFDPPYEVDSLTDDGDIEQFIVRAYSPTSGVRMRVEVWLLDTFGATIPSTYNEFIMDPVPQTWGAESLGGRNDVLDDVNGVCIGGFKVAFTIEKPMSTSTWVWIRGLIFEFSFDDLESGC